MNNKNALITKAMLASYISKKNVDYLGMLQPFILKVLPCKINTEIDIQTVVEEVNQHFGINIINNVVEKILIRLSKTKNNEIIKKATEKNIKKYYINKIIDTSDFDNRKNKINEAIISVVTSLKNFINEQRIVTKISDEDAQKLLIDFLNDYNYEVYSNKNNITKIQGREKNSTNNFQVAKFILNERKKNNGLYEEIYKIQEGYFASTAIYFFINNNCKDITNNLSNTKFILDTRLLIDVLEFNREHDANSLKELILLIQNNGGKLYTFQHYVDELRNILYKYLIDKKSRIYLDLNKFRVQHYSDVQVKLEMNILDKKIRKSYAQIEILSLPDYSSLTGSNTWHLDPSQLKSNILKYINYQEGEFGSAFKNDFETLQAMAYFEYINENNIFITQNTDLITVYKETVKSNKFRNKIATVITDINLSAILWLSNNGIKSNLPELTLLENSYAALNPTKDIMNEVLKIIEADMESNSEIIKEEAFVLRYDPYMADDISDITHNDKDNISDKTIIELKNRMRNRLKKEVAAEINKTAEQIAKEKYDEKFSKEWEERNKKLINKEIALTTQADNLKYRENTVSLNEENIQKEKLLLEEREIELSIIKAENNKMRKHIEAIEERENKKCMKKAKIVAKIFKLTLNFLFTLIFIFIYYMFIKDTMLPILNNLTFNNVVNVSIAIGGFLATFIPLEIWSSKIINKSSKKIYDHFYLHYFQLSEVLKEGDNHK